MQEPEHPQTIDKSAFKGASKGAMEHTPLMLEVLSTLNRRLAALNGIQPGDFLAPPDFRHFSLLVLN